MGAPTDGSFGAELRCLREARALTQEELAGLAGLTVKAIGALERGERTRPYPHTVRSLADAMELAEQERRRLEERAAPGTRHGRGPRPVVGSRFAGAQPALRPPGS